MDPKKEDYFTRARNLYGENWEKLKEKRVVLAGVGGVGSFALQGLARSNIGHLMLIDKDIIEPSNLNRQLVARTDTVGKTKVEVAAEDVKRINPDCEVVAVADFYDADMNGKLLEFNPDYILDCIDSLSSKKDLIRFALENKIPILSSMGMARKQDPSKISIMELEKTSYDPIAKQLRVWKRKNKIRDKIMVASSVEAPQPVEKGQSLPSAIFVPGTAGLLLASQAVQDLMKRDSE